MTISNLKPGNSFDFSLDARAFRDKLWLRLEGMLASSSIQRLEDDDLEWVNAAAGIPPMPPADEKERL